MKERSEDMKLLNEINALSRRVHLLRKHHMASDLLTEAEVLILDFLDQNAERPPTMRQVAKAIGISFSNLSKIINSMEMQKGLVQRAIDPNDRRQILLTISEVGKDILEKTRKEQRDRMKIIIPKLSGDEREIVAKGIAVFNRILDEVKS
jgi:DNA-binding MarR family transcriptional regulator